MSTHRHIDRICIAVLAVVLLLTVVFMNGEALEIPTMKKTMGYENKLFDTSTVHTIDIVMEDWDDFISNCENEEYVSCTVIIDNEAYKNVGIRAKGNTSLSSVSASDSDRYSFKIEFDHYESGKNYYGLDKVSLNNIIQDNTYMKDYISYQMMGGFGVSAPLCSYSYITVNGEDWGLYLAVESVEESFLTRNYGSGYGELYKPDSMSFGGGRGNGRDFSPDEFMEQIEERKEFRQSFGDMEHIDQDAGMGNRAESATDGEPENRSDAGNGGKFSAGDEGGMGSSDVKLQYIDDDPDSYSNIFDNAKTDVTSSDKQRLIAALKNLSENVNIEETVDVEAVIRYFVVHNFLCNADSYTGSMIHNYYLYEEDGQLSMIPWDYNLAFGGFQGGSDATDTVNEPIDSPVSNGSVDDRPMLAWIFSNEEYTQLYHQYFEELIVQYFDQGELEEMIDSVTELIAPYVEQDPTKFCTYEEFETGVSTLKEFCALRAESIRGQLEGTIPSTDDGQAGNEQALIDASHISISDMGSMNTGFSGGRQPDGMGGPDGTEMRDGMGGPGETEIPDGMEPPDGTEIPDGMKPSD